MDKSTKKKNYLMLIFSLTSVGHIFNLTRDPSLNNKDKKMKF